MITETEFRHIFRQSYPQLLFYATRIVGRAEADDVVQDAFVELWRHREAVENEAHCKRFVYQAAHCRAVNALKHRAVAEDYTAAARELALRRADYYAPDADGHTALEGKELQARINAAIARLPDKCRQAFMMSYLHDMRAADIAAIMGISVRTVNAHVYKALGLLRAELGPMALIYVLLCMAG